MPMLSVRRESSWQNDVALLLKQSDDLAALLYPGEYRQRLDPETLAAPGIHVLVARTDSVAVGCCALIERCGGKAEPKRMIVDEQARRQGVGMALLQAIEATASTLGIHLRWRSGYGILMDRRYIVGRAILGEDHSDRTDLRRSVYSLKNRSGAPRRISSEAVQPNVQVYASMLTGIMPSCPQFGIQARHVWAREIADGQGRGGNSPRTGIAFGGGFC
jgi:GNAT superfamily N-acetyltransferase